MAKEIDIDKIIYLEKNILKIGKDGTITTIFVDAEMDGIKCTFNYDRCVELDTKGYTYITLSIDNLYNLINLIEKAEKKYAKMNID
jgi:hypothetical protein